MSRLRLAARRATRIFPNQEALLRLCGALLAEQHDEWLTESRRYLPQASINRLLGGGPILDGT